MGRLLSLLRATASEASPSSLLGRWRQEVSSRLDFVVALPWPGSLSCGPLLNGAVQETTPAGALYPTDEVWYTDAGKTQELLHVTYTRDANQNVIQTVWQVYNLSGALELTVTDVFTYVGSYVSTRTRTVS